MRKVVKDKLITKIKWKAIFYFPNEKSVDNDS